MEKRGETKTDWDWGKENRTTGQPIVHAFIKLPMCSGTLNELLLAFCTSKLLLGEHAVQCVGCGGAYTPHQKKLCFSTVPDVLTLHLM